MCFGQLHNNEFLLLLNMGDLLQDGFFDTGILIMKLLQRIFIIKISPLLQGNNGDV
jgi:hypothetical protein